MYLGDDEPCNIIDKGNVTVSLSNGSMPKLKDVRHVPKLMRNMIYVDQLTDTEMKTTFDGDLCMITKSTMITTHDKKRRYPLHDVELYGFNFSCIIGCGCQYMASSTWAYEREGDEGYALQRKTAMIEVYRFRFL